MSMSRVVGLFIGRAGSGKGTQSKRLMQHLGEDHSFYIYTGDHLRALMDHKEFLTARLIREKIMNVGAKAPDFLAIWVWANEFIHSLKKDQNLVIDGSPRTLIEAKVLDEALAFYDIQNIFPFLLDVTREEAFRRLKARKRADDTDNAINARLDYYETTVVPAVSYYEKESKNKLIRIDGMPSEDKVFEQIVRALR